jgi:hypothetical protein
MRPHSLDLRERVTAVDEGEMSRREITRTFRGILSFVPKLLKRRRVARTSGPAPHGGGPSPVLDAAARWKLGRLAALSPG